MCDSLQGSYPSDTVSVWVMTFSDTSILGDLNIVRAVSFPSTFFFLDFGSGLADRKLWFMFLQVGSILNNHVGYGAILSRNSSVLLQCLQEYLETEEQWLFYLLAEYTGTTQVSVLTLWHQHRPSRI